MLEFVLCVWFQWPVAILSWRESEKKIGYSQNHTQNPIEVWPDVFVYRKLNVLGQGL